jgi:hypothetical protein
LGSDGSRLATTGRADPPGDDRHDLDGFEVIHGEPRWRHGKPNAPPAAGRRADARVFAERHDDAPTARTASYTSRRRWRGFDLDRAPPRIHAMRRIGERSTITRASGSETNP